MSLKLHFINSHLDHFPVNLRDVNEEPRERFHQDIKTMVDHYQGCWAKHVMTD